MYCSCSFTIDAIQELFPEGINTVEKRWYHSSDVKNMTKGKRLWNNSTWACIPSTRRPCAVFFFLEIVWQKVVFSLGGLCLKDFICHNVFSSKPRIAIGSELPGPGKQVRWQSAWLACNHENLHWIPRTRKKKRVGLVSRHFSSYWSTTLVYLVSSMPVRC